MWNPTVKAEKPKTPKTVQWILGCDNIGESRFVAKLISNSLPTRAALSHHQKSPTCKHLYGTYIQGENVYTMRQRRDRNGTPCTLQLPETSDAQKWHLLRPGGSQANFPNYHVTIHVCNSNLQHNTKESPTDTKWIHTHLDYSQLTTTGGATMDRTQQENMEQPMPRIPQNNQDECCSPSTTGQHTAIIRPGEPP